VSLIPIDEVVHFDVTTHHPSTGAVTDADSGPTYDVFEEATDTPILDDQTMTKRTSLTGNYRGSFTASAANGFEAGKWYSVVVSATVNSIAAKHVAMSFRIAPAESSAGVPKVDLSHWLGTGAATPTVAGVPEVDVTHVGGATTNVAALATNVDAIKAKTDNLPSDPADASVVAGLIAGVETKVDTIDGVVDAILVDTAEIGAAGAGLTDINLPNQTMDIVGNITGNLSGSVGSVTGNVGGNVAGSVGSVATGGIAAASFAAGAIDAAAIATNAIGADELAASAVTEIQAGLSTLDAAGVRSAVGLAAANLDTQLTAIDDAIDTEVAAIKAKTDNLPSDPADASDIAAAFSTVNSTLATIAAYIDTEVAAIKTVTDQLAAAQAEPSAAPAANATPLEKIAWLAALARNKITQTATTQTLLADNGTTTVAASTHSDDGTTHTRGEWA
jgi:hypothetical protein